MSNFRYALLGLWSWKWNFVKLLATVLTSYWVAGYVRDRHEAWAEQAPECLEINACMTSAEVSALSFVTAFGVLGFLLFAIVPIVLDEAVKDVKEWDKKRIVTYNAELRRKAESGALSISSATMPPPPPKSPPLGHCRSSRHANTQNDELDIASTTPHDKTPPPRIPEYSNEQIKREK